MNRARKGVKPFWNSKPEAKQRQASVFFRCCRDGECKSRTRQLGNSVLYYPKKTKILIKGKKKVEGREVRRNFWHRGLKRRPEKETEVEAGGSGEPLFDVQFRFDKRDKERDRRRFVGKKR
ncbi:hypothetical protein QQP08_026456 [Theobroma cacao]|nr:hypothetical protein QQP08_026456 [Theobroma cacao]